MVNLSNRWLIHLNDLSGGYSRPVPTSVGRTLPKQNYTETEKTINVPRLFSITSSLASSIQLLQATIYDMQHNILTEQGSLTCCTVCPYATTYKFFCYIHIIMYIIILTPQNRYSADQTQVNSCVRVDLELRASAFRDACASARASVFECMRERVYKTLRRSLVYAGILLTSLLCFFLNYF